MTLCPGLQRSGVRYTMEPDRRKAIELAIHEAQAGDIVLIAGKGHEKVQVTNAGRGALRRHRGGAERLAERGIRGGSAGAVGKIMKLTLVARCRVHAGHGRLRS